MKLAPVLIISLVAGGVLALAQDKPFPAPTVTGAKWVNSEAKGFDWKDRAGKVTVVHFWTFGCSNCKANLRAYDRVYAKFKEKGVDMIGIHTPELEMEKPEENVRKAVKDYSIKYPVLIDGDGANWVRWKQDVWPTVYVIDAKGVVRFKWIGELAWKGATGEKQMIDSINQLLAEVK